MAAREYMVSLREKNGLSQETIAAAIGCTKQYYNYIENGKRQTDMHLSMIRKIAEYYRLPVSIVVDQEIEYSSKK